MTAQVSLKWNLVLIFKMFYLGGTICLVSPRNILFEGCSNLYGLYSNQPFTWYKWLNGLFSNFWKIFLNMQYWFIDSYTGWKILSKKNSKKLSWSWFFFKGLISRNNIDLAFFPSLKKNIQAFFESNAKFCPSFSVSNTSTSISPYYLDYQLIANDYSLISICFYSNLLLTIFKRSWLIWKIEFSVYPQKLLMNLFNFSIIPFKSKIILNNLKWNLFYLESTFVGYNTMLIDCPWTYLARLFKYFFIFRKYFLKIKKKQLLWKSFYFDLKNKLNFDLKKKNFPLKLKKKWRKIRSVA